jgi:uncharacterized protein YjbI with pentapeptide repeats
LSSKPNTAEKIRSVSLAIAFVATIVAILGWILAQDLLLISGTGICVAVILPIILPAIQRGFMNSPLGRNAHITLACFLGGVMLLLWGRISRVDDAFWTWFNGLRWEAWGAVGQILIAILAVWVAWRQNEISEKLTGQQNLITQQQTIDNYFQGISELVLDPQGQLEDWPLERAIAQARTAALFGSVDPDGRAKILRFLSSANLLTPLKRDGLLGRAILDGAGGYVTDLDGGVRVVSLGTMLAGKDISKTDVRFCDLSGCNLLKTNLSGCNLTGADLSGAILAKANLMSADLNRVVFFHGKVETASPRDRAQVPNFTTGAFSGAVIEEANFSNVEDLSPENRQYLCTWGGTKTRRSIPGGCKNIPNLLGR